MKNLSQRISLGAAIGREPTGPSTRTSAHVALDLIGGTADNDSVFKPAGFAPTKSLRFQKCP